MKFWCEYPDTKVSPTDRAFDHVGMGVYPFVESENCAAVEVYTADGRMIYSGYASVGISRHEIGYMNGMLIVRIGERSMKIMH